MSEKLTDSSSGLILGPVLPSADYCIQDMAPKYLQSTKEQVSNICPLDSHIPLCVYIDIEMIPIWSNMITSMIGLVIHT